MKWNSLLKMITVGLFFLKAVNVMAVQDNHVNKKNIFNVKQLSKTQGGGNVHYIKSNRISLNFQNISVRYVLQLLAQFADKNLVISDDVTGQISLHLTNIPWSKALNIILQMRGLAKRNIDGVIFITRATTMAKLEKQEVAAKQAILSAEPLQSILLPVNYASAENIAKLIKNQHTSLLSKRGKISFDQRTNSVWIIDVPEKINKLRKFVHRLDIPVKQVLISARIVNIDKRYEHQLGIRWGITSGKHLSGTLQGANELVHGVAANQIPFAKRLNIDLPAIGTAANPAASMGLALVKIGGDVMLDLELSALESEGGAKIIATPKLLTANRQKAIIQAGEEIPYQMATSSGATSVAFKKAVLSLEVTPQITPNHKIILFLQVHQDKRGPDVLKGVPAIDTRAIKTQVLVNNGQTIVLGGIYQQSRSNNVERIPFLGSLPIIGHLFRHTVKSHERRELLIFVTPKIVNR